MTIGGTLAQARREAGLTVTQVSNDTRIRETVVRAIEHDNFTLCGGNFYARGHIRSIARVIGIDPEPLVAGYDDEHGGAPQALPLSQAFEPEIPIRFRERRAPNWSAAMAVVLVLVIGYLVVHAVTGRSSHAAHRAAHPVLVSASPSASRSVPGTATSAPRDEVTVQVKANQSSWLAVRNAKGKQLFGGVLAAGAAQKWTAKHRISLTVGNGEGVTLVVNGRNVGSPGGGGKAVNLNFGPGNSEAG